MKHSEPEPPPPMLTLSVDAVDESTDAASLDGDAASVVARAQAGDRAAMTTLLRQYEPMVRGIALARVGATDASDVCQEVFLQSWRRMPQLRDAHAFGPWLAAIARNQSMEWLRQRQGFTLRASSPSIAVQVDDGSERTRTEALKVLSLIRQLPEAYAETLVLRLVEGLTGPQIAACTGRTLGSVRVNLHRGMQLLRERLANTCRENMP